MTRLSVLAFVDDDRDHDDGALDDHLPERRDVHQAQAVVDHTDDQRADYDAPDGADAAVERRAADDGGGDHVQLQHVAQGRAAGPGAGGEDDACQASQQADQGVDLELRLRHRDAGDLRGHLVAADGVDGAAEAGAVEHQPHDDSDEGQQQDGHDALAKLIELGGGVADRPAIVVDVREATCGGHHAEGGDERRDPEDRDQAADDGANEGAHRQARHHG